MKLGLLTDIHEHLENLRSALRDCAADGVDQIIVIGDVFDCGKHIEETVELLAESKAVGVWGNHDFGLSYEPDEVVRNRYCPGVIEFMTGLHPTLEVEGCLFTHVEPWLDPRDLADLWYFDGPPDSVDKLQRSFSAVSHSVVFVGHYHRWLLTTESGITEWTGTEAITLDSGQRYLIAVHAVCEGAFAIFDTATRRLEPRTCAG